MSSPSVGETAHKVGTSETHASPGSSPKKRDVYRFPSPRIAGMEEGSPIRAISPSWSPATASRMVDSRRNSPAVPSSPLVDAENQGLVAYDDQRVPVATIANEMDVGEPLVGLSSAKEVLDGDDLKHKYAVLRRLQDQLVTCGGLEEQEAGEVLPFIESMAAVCQALKLPGLGTLRMIELMCSIASTLACLTGRGFTHPASKIVPELLKFLRIPETGVRKTVSQSVETILEECPAMSTLHAATASLLDAKNPYLRRKGSRFLCFMLDKWPKEALSVSQPLIMDQIRKAMADSDANIRREGRSTFGAFVRLWPTEGVRMYNALDSVSQRATLQEQPFVSNFVSGDTFPSCEEGNPIASSSLTPKARSVSPSPASFGRAHPRGIGRDISTIKGAVRSASRLPSLHSISKGSYDAGKIEDNSTGAAEVTISPSRSVSSEESGLGTNYDEAGACGITPGELRRSLMGNDDELPSPWLKHSNSLPRCVDAHLTVDLPSRRLLRTCSPQTFRGDPSKGTMLTPTRNPVLGGVSPSLASRSATRRVRFSPFKEEYGLPKMIVTSRATIEEDAVAIAKGQHTKKIPCMLLVLLMAFITVVVFGVFGIVFLSMGKLPGGVIRAIHSEAEVFTGSTDVRFQKELNVSVESLGACTAFVDVSAVMSNDDDDGTSSSEISQEYCSTFSEGLTRGSTLYKTSAAVGDIDDVLPASDRGETETSNQHSSQRIHPMVENSDTMSTAPGRTDPEESISPPALDYRSLAKDTDTIIANLDRINQGESSPIPLASKGSFSVGLVEPGEPPSRLDKEDLGDFIYSLALDNVCLMVSVTAFAVVGIWIAGVKSRLLNDGARIVPSGVGGDENMSTPPRRNAREETQQEEEELGCYNKIEVIRSGNLPGTVRSVKRSRRIESAKKAQNSWIEMDETG